MTHTAALGAEIENGTGVQAYWNCDGVKVWQLDVKNYKRTRCLLWNDAGQLLADEHYVDGHVKSVREK